MNRTAFTLLLLCAACTICAAQHDDWEVTLSRGRKLADVRLQSLEGDSLALISSGQVKKFDLQSIIELSRSESGSRSAKGFLAGAAIGAGAGFMVGEILHSGEGDNYLIQTDAVDPRVAGPILGGLAGGLFGAAFGAATGSKSYDMAAMTPEAKTAVIESILRTEGLASKPETSVGHDVVHLKDGGEIRGSIQEVVPDSTLRIRKPDGEIYVYQMRDVARISTEADPPAAGGSTPLAVVPHHPVEDSTALARPRPHLAVYAGAAIPTGDFSDLRDGGAVTGFEIGADLRIPVSPAADWLTDVTLTFNGVDEQSLGSLADTLRKHNITADLGSWTSIWAMTGVRAISALSPSVSLYGTAQVGLLFGQSPEIALSGGGNFYKVASSSATAFAYAVGAGVNMGDRFTIGVRYDHGEPQYTIAAGPQSVAAKQSTSLFELTAGIRF